MGHYDRAREREAAERREKRRDRMEAEIKSEVSDMDSTRHLEAVHKVARNPEKYATLFSFLNSV